LRAKIATTDEVYKDIKSIRIEVYKDSDVIRSKVYKDIKRTLSDTNSYYYHLLIMIIIRILKHLATFKKPFFIVFSILSPVFYNIHGILQEIQPLLW
jgi:hypothetical protein